MQVKIGDTTYTIRIGLAALNYLDKIYTLNIEGMEFGFSLNKIYVDIRLQNIMAIANFIKAGTITEAQKPSNVDIENFIGEMDLKGQQDFFEEMKEELGKSPVTRVRWGQIDKNVKKKEKEIKSE